jgi:hypothetical protein
VPQIYYRFVVFYFLNIARVEEMRNSNKNLVLNPKNSQWTGLNKDGKIILKLMLKE